MKTEVGQEMHDEKRPHERRVKRRGHGDMTDSTVTPVFFVGKSQKSGG